MVGRFNNCFDVCILNIQEFLCTASFLLPFLLPTTHVKPLLLLHLHAYEEKNKSKNVTICVYSSAHDRALSDWIAYRCFNSLSKNNSMRFPKLLRQRVY